MTSALIVDQQPMMRRAIRELLRDEFELRSCEEAATARDALRILSGKSFDVAIVAMLLPIMYLLALGKKPKEIAAALSLTSGTIYTYRHRILKKMKLTNNVELSHYALKHNLVD